MNPRTTVSRFARCLAIIATVGCKPPEAAAPAATTTTTAETKTDARNEAKPGDLPAPDDVKAVPADAEKQPSGLASKMLQKGSSTEKPTADDTVEVHYTGWTIDGKMFDSSVKRGRPAKFPLKDVIKGWTEGVPLMTVGEKRRFWIPADLAYGKTSRRPGAPSGMLVFDIELLSIPKVPEAPKDVAAAPADAQKTKSGLAYKTLRAGDGKTHPTASDSVEVHYACWTKDGQLFDASYKRGETITFSVSGVTKRLGWRWPPWVDGASPVPGWTEAVQLMTVGEKAIFWIPSNLAYGDVPSRPGAPAGQVTFQIELIAIPSRK